MFQRRRAWYLILIIAILLVSAGMVWLRSYVFSSLAVSLNEKIDSLRVEGWIITYDSLSVDWRKNTIRINGALLEKNAYDTTCTYPEFVKIATIRADGLRLFPLIFRNILSFENLHLEDGHVVMRRTSLFKQRGGSSADGNEFRLRADRVSIKSAHIEYLDSTGCENILSLKTDFVVEKIGMNFHKGRPLVWHAGRMIFDSLQMRMSKSPYTYEIRRAQADLKKELLTIDTIKLLPDFAKFEYGHRFGYEVDRIEGTLPFVRVRGFRMDFADSLRLSAGVMDVQFYLKIFRDKRLPFKRVKKLLPTTRLRNLPFALVIDSLKIIKSFVQYEELYSDGTAPGRIYFDDLEAVFSNIDNRAVNSEIKLKAHSLLMGDGKVTLSAIFPMAGNKRSTMQGSLRNFTLPKINSMLTPATNLKIESGTVDNLLFNFFYTARTSHGEIELNYRDLKIATFKEDEESGGKALEKDNLKTFMLNMFVFKKNMDERTPDEKRKGTIDYVRDETRSIFNYWMKSVLSGIKSAYDLDKKTAKKSKRQLKQEQRLVRREARKMKKAKNKDRG